MDMNNVNIEEIVKQVLSGMTGNAPAAASAPAASTGIPKTARVAVLTEKEHFELKEYPIPPLGDDDILVKVEGCGVCGTDAHEFKRDPFNLIPVALGHEGTGEIVAMGKNVKVDTAGKPVKVGDKVVTCMIFKDDPDITMFDLNKKDVGGADMKIVAYSRETSSGTYEFFKESVLKNKNYMNGILSMPATGAIIQSVSQTKGAIGYVGLAYINKEVKPIHVSYDAGKTFTEPSFENAKNKAYPIVRPLFYYYDVKNEGKVKPFIDYILSAEGQATVKQVGYIPVK